MKTRLNCITQPHGILNEDGDLMSPEEYIIYCARLSSKERVNSATAPKLLNYLMDHKHWSPFEMVSIGVEVETSRAIAQQILRHRSFSFQEFSQRYAEVTDMEPVNLRMAAIVNRQSSTEKVKNRALYEKVNWALLCAEQAYKHLLEAGVAKECARMVLPLTTQTTIVMHGTLRSWIHFFSQRCDPHAQLEIQQLAYSARADIAEAFPWTAAALGWVGDTGNA